MLTIQKICSVEFVHSVLREGADIDQIIEALVLKAEEEAGKVESLEELEGESIYDGDLRMLQKCPMVPLLNSIKKEELARTGKEALPGFYRDIVERAIEQNPGEGSLLHPLCIVHQAMRDIISSQKGSITRQIACRSADTGKVVFARNGLLLAGLTEDQARDQLDGLACLYITKPL